MVRTRTQPLGDRQPNSGFQNIGTKSVFAKALTVCRALTSAHLPGLRDSLSFPHFRGKETEAQRDRVACPTVQHLWTSCTSICGASTMSRHQTRRGGLGDREGMAPTLGDLQARETGTPHALRATSRAADAGRTAQPPTRLPSVCSFHSTRTLWEDGSSVVSTPPPLSGCPDLTPSPGKADLNQLPATTPDDSARPALFLSLPPRVCCLPIHSCWMAGSQLLPSFHPQHPLKYPVRPFSAPE